MQLYDFSKSQDERKNLASDHPAVAEEMVRRLLAWRRSLAALEMK